MLRETGAVFGKKRKQTKKRIMKRQRVKRTGFRARIQPLLDQARLWSARLARLLACLALSIIVAGAAQAFHHFVYKSAYFRLTDIETLGVSDELRQELLALAELDDDGINLVRLSTQDTREKLMRNPRLRRATVVKRYPNKLVIRGEERQPAAIVSSGGFYSIDSEGVVLAAENIISSNFRPLPFITGLPSGEIVLGERLDAEGVSEALDLIAALRRLNRDLYRKLSEAHLDADEGLSIYLAGGAEVRFGRGSPIDKLPQLEYYLQQHPDPRDTDYIDLRFPEMMVSKPTEGAI